ncbi:MAG: hypothetical protein ACFNLP_05340, partial [Segatella oulorum]
MKEGAIYHFYYFYYRSDRIIVRCQTKVHNLPLNLVWGFSMNYINKKVYLHNDNKKESFSRFSAENIRILVKGYS